jgi:hypothetical protein
MGLYKICEPRPDARSLRARLVGQLPRHSREPAEVGDPFEPQFARHMRSDPKTALR